MTGSSNSGVTFLNDGVTQDAGVVHHDVDAPVTHRARTARSPRHPRGWPPESALLTASPPASRISATTRFGSGRGTAGAVDRAAEVVDDDRAPATRELERVAAAEPAAGAGDDGDLIHRR